MASTTRAFFVGVGTTFIILTAGFGGGLILAKNVMEPTPPGQTRSALAGLPPVRVILPASAEAAQPPQTPAVSPQPTGEAQAVAAPERAAELSPPISTQEVQRTPEKEKQAQRAERRKAEAEEREHRKRVAARKARRDAARIARQMQEQQPQRRDAGIMAFDEQSGSGRDIFGN
jgi:type IV secretory pathway VirB10-like protein